MALGARPNGLCIIATSRVLHGGAAVGALLVRDAWGGMCCCALRYKGTVFVGLDTIEAACETVQVVKTALNTSA
jgi:hypothetical protein